MTTCAESIGQTMRRAFQHAEGGAIPASALFFHAGNTDEAESLVLKHHYSRRVPGNVQFVGTFNTAGGLFGTRGECVAAIFFSSPPTRWSEPVIELTRLVRGQHQVPLSLLVTLAIKEIRRQGKWDLCVSFADRTQGHHGGIYQACSWNYDGCRERRMDGLIVDGAFVPGRSCNSAWCTQSPERLRAQLPSAKIEPHFDEGKHLYWKAIRDSGTTKAKRLGLKSISYPKR